MTSDEPSTSTYADDLSENDSETSPLLDKSESGAEEKRLVRKLDGRILPIVCLLCFFACRSPFSA